MNLMCRLECVALREDLTTKYKADHRTALAELANIKDRALENARKKWDAERGKLTKQVQ